MHREGEVTLDPEILEVLLLTEPVERHPPPALAEWTVQLVLSQAGRVGEGTAHLARASQSDDLKVGLPQQNVVCLLVLIHVDIDYFKRWIPGNKSEKLIFGDRVPDSFKLELCQSREAIQPQDPVVPVVRGDFECVEIPKNKITLALSFAA